ncbi:uncharacterized protein [Aegilops tauschii subsp. strangulata]|uniref:uncharacterized protein n=1 Tax=Aegilops tauschii subsp. strangulata TaxID=200361 RepID=UPI000989AD8D|nr:uncharacterized protein LOC109779681 [Aegilops tauschii subsp. strangulata]
MLVSPTKDKLYYAVQLIFQHGEKVFNNITEYEGLIVGLKAAAILGFKRLTIKAILGLELQHVPRGTNKEADDIAKRASRCEPQIPGVIEERLFKPSATPPTTGTTLAREELPPSPLTGALARGSTSGARLLLVLEPQEGSWTKQFEAYLLHDTLPEKEEDAECVAHWSTAYCLQGGELYRRRPNDISLRCISEDQGRELLADIHEGECRHHSSLRTLMGKVIRIGFYSSMALHDATDQVQSCEAYQFHAKQIHQPVQGLQTIPLSWPFAVWGLDILEPFPRVDGGYRYLYIAIKKFTKWAEVEPVRTTPVGSAVKFISGLVSQFGIPNRIITDNICYASVVHPRSNVQAERANAEVLRGLKTISFKKKLEACSKGWLDVLQSVLWSIRATVTKPTGETPFFLVYRAKVVLSLEIKHGSPRVLAFGEARQDAVRGTNLVLGEEARRQASLHAARYQQALQRYYSRNIRSQTPEVGPLQGGPPEARAHVGGPVQG